MKTCTTCLEEKPLTEFHNNKEGTGGKASLCKPCRNARNRQRYRDDPERSWESNRIWRMANKERLAAQQREYRLANKDKLAAQKREYYEANAHALKAKSRAWRLANPERFAASQKAHYAATRDKRITAAREWKQANRERSRDSDKRTMERVRRETAPTATRKGAAWEPWEDAAVMDYSKTAKEWALQLGRTHGSVVQRRVNLTKRFMNTD